MRTFLFMKKYGLLFSCLSGLCLLSACGEGQVQKKYDPIVLGDSATIVTETNPEYLKNNVEDIEVQTVNKDTISTPPTTAVAPKIDTPKTELKVAEQSNTTAPRTSGLAIDIGNGTYIVLEGVKVKDFKTQDGTKDNELVYKLTSGAYNSAQIKVHNGKVTKSTYRYAVVPQVETNNKRMPLSSLGDYTSDWASLSVKNGIVAVPKISNLKYKKVSASQLKKATEKVLKDRRYKKSAIDAVLRQIGNRATVQQKPFSLNLALVQVKIQGTDAKGKSFDKIIKIEL